MTAKVTCGECGEEVGPLLELPIPSFWPTLLCWPCVIKLIEKQDEELDAARSALAKYGKHKEMPQMCPKAWHSQDGRADEFPCTCGLSGLLAGAAPQPKEEK